MRELTDIPGFEGQYAVTRDGQVWSYPKPCTGITEGKAIRQGKWLSLIPQRGYLVVRLGVRHTICVHRLIALTYLPQPPGKLHVNHLNGIKHDNRVENLACCTQAENNRHAWRHALMRAPRKFKGPEVRRIRYLRKNRNMTHQQLANMFGVGRTTIARVLDGIGYGFAHHGAKQVGRRAQELAQQMQDG
jgi:hypothetical protein